MDLQELIGRHFRSPELRKLAERVIGEKNNQKRSRPSRSSTNSVGGSFKSVPGGSSSYSSGRYSTTSNNSSSSSSRKFHHLHHLHHHHQQQHDTSSISSSSFKRRQVKNKPQMTRSFKHGSSSSKRNQSHAEKLIRQAHRNRHLQQNTTNAAGSSFSNKQQRGKNASKKLDILAKFMEKPAGHNDDSDGFETDFLDHLELGDDVDDASFNNNDDDDDGEGWGGMMTNNVPKGPVLLPFSSVQALGQHTVIGTMKFNPETQRWENNCEDDEKQIMEAFDSESWSDSSASTISENDDDEEEDGMGGSSTGQQDLNHGGSQKLRRENGATNNTTSSISSPENPTTINGESDPVILPTEYRLDAKELSDLNRSSMNSTKSKSIKEPPPPLSHDLLLQYCLERIVNLANQ